MVFIASKRLIQRGFISLALIILALYILSNYSITNKEYDLKHSKCIYEINFLLPIDKKSFSENLKIYYQIPINKPQYSISWTSSSKAKIIFVDNYIPKGQKITIDINCETQLPLLKKRFKNTFRLPVKPEFIGINKVKNLSTKGPLLIKFDVPLIESSVQEGMQVVDAITEEIIKGKFMPLKVVKGKEAYLDNSRWRFIPEKPFKNSQEYFLKISPNIKSEAEIYFGKSSVIQFKTAPKPVVKGSLPNDGDTDVSLYPKIEITSNEILKKGEIVLKRIDGDQRDVVPGQVLVKGTTLLFVPKFALLPNSEYSLQAIGYSVHNEKTDLHQSTFTTISMNDRLWIDVKLGDIHTVTIYMGQQAIRHMVASGGKETSQTPLGTYYTSDRGYSFWSSRFGEGALYWVRLVGQILFHSVPRGNGGHLKEEEHAKLGLPASHGCIRLDDKDAKWLFDTIPYGTPVIIHK